MSELIGTRRPSRARSLRTWTIVAIVLLVSALIAYLLYRRVSRYAHPDGSAPKGPVEVIATSAEDGLHYHQSRLSYLGPLGILHTEGGSHDIGAQHGRLLATELATLQENFQANVNETVSTSGFLGSRLHNIRLRWRWRTLDDGIPGHQLVELAGLVRGAEKSGTSLSYEDQVRQSAILDVGEPAMGSSGVASWTIARTLTLLAPIQSEMGNRLIVAHSMSLPGVADGGQAVREHPLLHISHPEDALAYASLGWPGLIGVVSGINESRIGVFLHFAKTKDVQVNREAQPSALIAKEILENANTLDDAISILKHANSLGTAIFVIVDGNERTWAVVERTPSRIDLRKGSGPEALVDELVGKKIKDDPIADRSRRSRPMVNRRKRAKQLLKRAISSPEEIVAILRDQKSSDGTALVLGHRAALDDLESIHTALFDVGSMVLWVSESSDASGAFRAIDLRHVLLPNANTRSAPPPDISHALGTNQGARAGIREARRHLRSARRARNSGELKRARELAAMALSRSPKLPEALLLAGELARESNDELSARALLQRFLELGADDLRAKEQAEAWLGSP